MRGPAAAAIAALALSPLALTGAACEITLPGDDGGAEGGGGGTGTTQTQTVGDQCTAVFTELCTQAISRCGDTGFSLDQCIAANQPTCCTGSACNQTSAVPASDVTGCQQAIDGEDCNGIANSATPSACTAFVSDQ